MSDYGYSFGDRDDTIRNYREGVGNSYNNYGFRDNDGCVVGNGVDENDGYGYGEGTFW